MGASDVAHTPWWILAGVRPEGPSYLTWVKWIGGFVCHLFGGGSEMTIRKPMGRMRYVELLTC